MKKILSILFIIIILINSGQQVYATSKFDEIFFNLNNIIYYDATEICNSNSSPSDLSGVDNAEKIWNFLKSKGFTDAAIAGILGNSEIESGVNPKKYEADYIEKIANLHDKMKNNPTIEALGLTWSQWQNEIYPTLSLNKEGYFHGGKHYIGIGFVQWTGIRTYRMAEKAKSSNSDIWSLGFQLQYLLEEEDKAEYINNYKNFNGSARDAADDFRRNWIINNHKTAERLAAAEEYYNKFKGSGGTGGGIGGGQTEYTFIGDSITVGVKSQIESSFTGSNVKAEVGQGVDWAVNQLSDIKDTVVINLGTNDKFANGKNLLEKLKDKKVYLVDTYGKGGSADFETTNKNIESIAKEFSNVQVLSWKKYLDENGGRDKYYAQEAGGANYHLNEEGKTLYIKFLKDKLSGGSSSNTSGSCKSSSNGGKFATSYQASYQTDDGFSIISQYDPRWADKPGNNGTRGNTSCGPFSLIMAISALTGRTPDIDDFVQKSTKYNVPGGAGTGYNLLNMLDDTDYGVKYKQLQKSEAEINKTLDSGGIVMVSGRGPRPFLAGGHWILIRKKTGSGKWMVADPGGTNDSYKAITNKEWDPSNILPYMDEGGIFEITKK